MKWKLVIILLFTSYSWYKMFGWFPTLATNIFVVGPLAIGAIMVIGGLMLGAIANTPSNKE